MNKRTLKAAIGHLDGSALTLRNRAAIVHVERRDASERADAMPEVTRATHWHVAGDVPTSFGPIRDYADPVAALNFAVNCLAAYN